jgi:hypothetical protein
MDRLIADASMRRLLGESGRRWAVGNFTWSRAAERLNRLIMEVVKLPTACSEPANDDGAGVHSAVAIGG